MKFFNFCKLSISLLALLPLSSLSGEELYGDYSVLGERNFQIYAGPLVQHLNLQVDREQSQLFPHRGLKLNGTLWGFYGGIEYDDCSGLWATFDALWSTGRITGRGSRRVIHEQEFEEKLGWNFFTECGFFAGLEITPFAGLGYRNVVQNHSEKSSSLKLRYRIFYIPIGFLLNWNYNECLSLGFTFKYTPQVDSTIQISKNRGSRIRLKTKQGFNVELPMTYHFDDCFSLSVIPFWKYVKDGSSNHLIIPAQIYNYWGSKLIAAYNF